MSKLLFEETPRKSNEYMRNNKATKIMLALMTTVFLLIGLICLFLKLYLVSVFPFIFAIWLSFNLMKAFLQEKQHLYIYEDKICYKNTCQRKAKEICVSPYQYTIQLKHATPKSGYTVKFIFRKTDGENLFTYKAVSIIPSMFQAEKQQWEIDLFAIGCTVVDLQEVIKNT